MQSGSLLKSKEKSITRRTLLLGTIACATSIPLVAQEPRRIAKNSISKSYTPIASRTIRLAPITAKLPRAVVTAIASDPRGDLIAVSGDDHAIRMLDAKSMRVVKTVYGHRDLIRTLAFDHQGDRLVSAGNDGQLIVWDRDNDFKIIQRMRGTPALCSVAFAPNGNEMAAVGFDNAIYMICQRQSGKEQRDNPVFHCECKDLRTVKFRDDGKIIAVAGRSGNLHLFDSASGEHLLEKTLHEGRVHDLVFHRDANTLVSVAEDGKLVVFDTKRRRVIHRVNVTTGKLFAVTLLNSSHVAVAGSDNVVRVVNTDTGQVVRSLKGHQGSIPTLASSNGVLFSGGFDATLRRWALTGHLRNEERIAEGEHQIDR